MIDELLSVIKDEADNFLRLKMKDNSQQYVHLIPVVDLSGKPAINENAIALTLIRVEEDRQNKSDDMEHKLVGEEVYYYNASLRLNLYILFSASFADGREQNYKEALKRLSYIVSCFQAKRVFTPQNTPNLSPSFGKIWIDFYNMPIEDQNHFWGIFGNLYRPSVYYRLRALRVQENRVIGVGAPGESGEFDLGEK